jgi:hypothetical protein
MSEDIRTETTTVDVQLTNGKPKEDLYDVLETHVEPRPVWIRTKKDGQPERHEVRELGDKDLAWVMRRMGRRVQVVDGKPVKQDYEGMHADLIHLCLYGPDNKRVNKDVINGWGTNIKQRLFYICQEHNALLRKVEEEEGKD